MSPELLSTHQVLSLFEKSKFFADEVFDNLTGVMLSLDRDGNLLRSNKFLSRILSIDDESILGIHISQLFSPDHFPVFAGHLKTLAKKPDQVIEFELPLLMQDKSTRDYLWQIGPLETIEGRLRNSIFTCAGRDISEVKDAQSKLVTLAKDLEVAETLQNLLLPQSSTLQTDYFQLAAYYSSASIAGGDYWTYHFRTPTKLCILVGDVSGHGTGPAMVTALVSGCVNTILGAARSGEKPLDIPNLLRAINDNLNGLKDQPYWMTMSAVEIDATSDTLTWWSAAAPLLIVLNRDGTTHPICQPSRPLGAGEFQIEHGSFPFAPGSRLLILTDGVLEVRNAEGSEFGARRVSRLLQKTKALHLNEVRSELPKLLESWRGPTPPDDDMTFVLVDRV